ncbi:MAG: Two-component response regulator [Myxococcales bacterium]|nr:Two-component response regulator [Myxococcales bacterium]
MVMGWADITFSMASPLRVLIIEDEGSVRRGLVEMLRADPGIDVSDARTGTDGLALARRAPPNVAIVDLGLPDVSGIEVIAMLRRTVPTCISLVFTMFDDAPTILSALRAGARGYLLKSAGQDRVLSSLREALGGGLPLSPAVASHLVDTLLQSEETVAEEPLTPREIELLALLARGQTYAQCAASLNIGVGTVQGYVKSIYTKLDVSSKAEAAVAAMRLGIVR